MWFSMPYIARDTRVTQMAPYETQLATDLLYNPQQMVAFAYSSITN